MEAILLQLKPVTDPLYKFPVHARAGAAVVGFTVLFCTPIGPWLADTFLRFLLQAIFLLHLGEYVWNHRYTLLGPVSHVPQVASFTSFLKRKDGWNNADGVHLGEPMPADCTDPDAVPHVVITGGAMGIGKQQAERYVALGYHVTVWDINEAALTQTQQELVELAAKRKNKALPLMVKTRVVDVTSEAAVRDAVQAIEAEKRRIDILTLNAGIVTGRRIEESTDENVNRLYQVNVLHLFRTCRYALPWMRNCDPKHRAKKVVVIGSVAAWVGAARVSDYNSSKAAANIFTEALAAEVHGSDISVMLVCPYAIDTGMFRGFTPLRLLPLLHSDDVSNAILDGVKHNKVRVIVPNYIFIIPILKNLYPAFLNPVVDRILGGSTSMNTFVGSDSQKQINQTQRPKQE